MMRLEKIFSFIDRCGVFADIGCDHGKLCKLVADAGLAQSIIAADISLPSLSKAKALLKDVKNVSFCHGDGFKGLSAIPDTAVISGMGGREIISILKGVEISHLVLQPQNHIPELRQFLTENGYKIVKDELVMENKKFYTVLKAEAGNGGVLTKAQCEWGVYYASGQALLREKLQHEKQKLLSYKLTEKNSEKLKIIEEVELCLR